MAERKSWIVNVLAEYEAKHEFARRLLLPVEDQILYGQRQLGAGYRWFRSPNVVDLETYRRLKSDGHV